MDNDFPDCDGATEGGAVAGWLAGDSGRGALTVAMLLLRDKRDAESLGGTSGGDSEPIVSSERSQSLGVYPQNMEQEDSLWIGDADCTG